MIDNNIWLELPKAAIEPLSIEIIEENPYTYKIERRFCFSKGFIGFDGHFPNSPILPGVVQLSCIRYMCSLFFNRELNIFQIPKVKFIKMILPEEKFKISIIVKELTDYIQANFKIIPCKNTHIKSNFQKHKEIIISKGIIYLK